MVVEIHPALADWSIGLVVVVQALKIKQCHRTQCVHDIVCMFVYGGVYIL